MMLDIQERLLTSTDNDGIVRLRRGSKSALLLPATDLGAGCLAQPTHSGLYILYETGYRAKNEVMVNAL